MPSAGSLHTLTTPAKSVLYLVIFVKDPLCPVCVCPACLNWNLCGLTAISFTPIVASSELGTGCKSKLFVSSMPPVDSAINFCLDAFTSKFFLDCSNSFNESLNSISLWSIPSVLSCCPLVPGKSFSFCILSCSWIISIACSVADFFSLPVSFTISTFAVSWFVSSFKGLVIPLALFAFLATFAPLVK